MNLHVVYFITSHAREKLQNEQKISEISRQHLLSLRRTVEHELMYVHR